MVGRCLLPSTIHCPRSDVLAHSSINARPLSSPAAARPSSPSSSPAATPSPLPSMVGCCLLFCHPHSTCSHCLTSALCRRPPVMRTTTSTRPPEDKARCSRLPFSQRWSQRSIDATWRFALRWRWPVSKRHLGARPTMANRGRRGAESCGLWFVCSPRQFPTTK